MKQETFSCTRLESIGLSVCVGSLDHMVVQSLVCFVAIGHCLSCHTFDVYFRFFQHLKKCVIDSVYMVSIHIFLSAIFL